MIAASINYARKISIFVFLILSSILFSSVAFSQDLNHKINTLKWVAYAPTNYNPEACVFPSEESIQKDLAILRKYNFDGIVTYGSEGTLSLIPRLAKESGFTGVIMGIWDIKSRSEFINATLALNYADGYCIGNEGLNKRYSLDELKEAILSLKKSTDKPVTTTEEVFDYANDDVFNIGDWIFPNMHPFLCNISNPDKAVIWLEKHYDRLRKHTKDDRPVLIKETGFPTRGLPLASQRNQKKFFSALNEKDIRFVYFEAFDQSWKNSSSCEMYWGLFDCNRRPKSFIKSSK